MIKATVIAAVAALVLASNCRAMDMATSGVVHSTQKPTSFTRTATNSTPIYLDITAAGTDPFGIAHVSGFYGPGAWAAWFLLICASWHRIYRNARSKIDLNTWLYLLGTNWAALDLVRSIARIQSLEGRDLDPSGGGDPLIWKELGQAGAAFTVLRWGAIHASAQAVVGISQEFPSHSLAPLLFAQLFPGIALIVALFTIRGYPIPAFYYPGICGDHHQILVTFGAMTGISLLSFSLIFGLEVTWVALPRAWQLKVTPVVDPVIDLCDLWGSDYCLAAYFTGILVIFPLMISSSEAKYYLLLIMLPFLPACMIFSCHASFTACLAAIVQVGIYVWHAYTPWRSIKPSDSCFFMPCAPQAISDSDQAFALLAGLVTFFGAEIAPVYVKRWMAASRSRRLFEQEVGHRIEVEMASRTNSRLAAGTA